MTNQVKVILILSVLGLASGCARSFESIPGPAGATGQAGSNGTDGSNGQNGATGAVGPQGETGEAGPQGEAGVNGTNGVDGQDGAVGATGAQGIPGAAGTSVFAVKLCPGVPVVYPTSFPESALCLQNKLYGVYWDGIHAFLAELPPGNYSSTSPQGCNLRVGLNCQVTN